MYSVGLRTEPLEHGWVCCTDSEDCDADLGKEPKKRVRQRMCTKHSACRPEDNMTKDGMGERGRQRKPIPA
jgi:hypothetical protein